MVGQIWRQVRTHRHRAHPWASTTVRDAEGLVQIEVRDICAELARLGQANQCVEVGAIHVHLPAAVMDDGADLANGLLKHSMRGG